MNFRKIISLMAVMLLCLSAIVIPTSAATAGINTKTSVYVGDTFDLTVNFSDSAGIVTIDDINRNFITYDSSVLECIEWPTNYNNSNNKLVWFDDSGRGAANKSFTFKFKAKKAGSSGVQVNAKLGIGEGGASQDIKQPSTRITVVDKSTLSGNANLKYLAISKGTLTPAFSPNVTSYTVQVDNSVTEVLISTSTQESAALIDVEGSKQMKVGENTRKVIVTAPNGTKKTYTIKITRAAAGTVVEPPPPTPVEPDNNPYKITVNNNSYYISTDYTNIEIPHGFSYVTVTVNGIEAPAVMDTVNNVTMVYATDESGINGQFYRYDNTKDEFSVYRYFYTDTTRFVALDYTENKIAPEGFYYTTVAVGDYKVSGFMYNDTALSDFVIFYGTTADGKEGFFRYDKTDGSVQRMPEFASKLTAASGEENEGGILDKFGLMSAKNKAVIIAMFVTVLGVVIMAVILITNRIKAKKEKEAAELEQDDVLQGVNKAGGELYIGGIEEDMGANGEDVFIFSFTDKTEMITDDDGYEDEDDDF